MEPSQQPGLGLRHATNDLEKRPGVGLSLRGERGGERGHHGDALRGSRRSPFGPAARSASRPASIPSETADSRDDGVMNMPDTAGIEREDRPEGAALKKGKRGNVLGGGLKLLRRAANEIIAQKLPQSHYRFGTSAILPAGLRLQKRMDLR